MKNIILLALAIFFSSCDSENPEVSSVDSSYRDSISKHFVDINEIKTIVAGKSFKNFMSKFDTLNYEKSSGLTSAELELVDFKEYKDKNDVAAFYLGKVSDNSIILFAADDRSHAIMAVLDDPCVNDSWKLLPDVVLTWLGEEIRAIEFARDNNIAPTNEVDKEWEALKLPPPPVDPDDCISTNYSLGPLLSTTWGQGDNYNDALNLHWGCTLTINGQPPVGCVATATAQIMRFHQFPANYNWSSMPYTSGSSAVAQLMANVAYSENMQFACAGSGTLLSSASAALTQVFGYSSATHGDYSASAILAELQGSKPVLISGDQPNNQNGHAWVADGFNSGYQCTYDFEHHSTGGYNFLYYHMNWGWSGLSNGYYNTNVFVVSNGLYMQNFSYARKMVTNIRK